MQHHALKTRHASRRQKKEKNRDDKIKCEELDAFEPVALAVTANLLGHKGRRHDRGDFRQAEF